MEKMEIELSRTIVSDDKSEHSSLESSSFKSYLDNDDSMLVSDSDSDNNNENNDENIIEDSKMDMEPEGPGIKLSQVIHNQMVEQSAPSQNNCWQEITNDLFSNLNHSWLTNFNEQTGFIWNEPIKPINPLDFFKIYFNNEIVSSIVAQSKLFSEQFLLKYEDIDPLINSRTFKSVKKTYGSSLDA